MSGFGESLRAWANIGGGDPTPPEEENSEVPTPQTPSDPDEIRRKRLARMAGGPGGSSSSLNSNISSGTPRASKSAPTDMETTPVASNSNGSNGGGPRGRLDFTSPDLQMGVGDDNDNDGNDLDDEGGVTPMDLSTSQDEADMSKTVKEVSRVSLQPRSF